MLTKFRFKSFCNLNITNNDSFIVTKTLGSNKNILGLYLNNAKKKNALSSGLIESLNNQIDNINKNLDYRAVLLLSSQPGYFCAGADLKERETMTSDQVFNFVNLLRTTFHNFSTLKIPTICGIDGYALGGGLELALSCDIRVATKSSVIGLSEVSLGIIPGAGGTQRLPRLIGASKAKELIFTASRLSGEESLNYGILNNTVENYESLEVKCIEIAEKIAKNAPLAIINAKKAINEGVGLDINYGLKVEEQCYSNILHTKDRVEGMKAFLEKRKPNYKGI